MIPGGKDMMTSDLDTYIHISNVTINLKYLPAKPVSSSFFPISVGGVCLPFVYNCKPKGEPCSLSFTLHT